MHKTAFSLVYGLEICRHVSAALKKAWSKDRPELHHVLILQLGHLHYSNLRHQLSDHPNDRDIVFKASLNFSSTQPASPQLMRRAEPPPLGLGQASHSLLKSRWCAGVGHCTSNPPNLESVVAEFPVAAGLARVPDFK